VYSSDRVFVAAALALCYKFLSGQGFSFYLFSTRTIMLSHLNAFMRSLVPFVT
jgi:hypothetical protein